MRVVLVWPTVTVKQLSRHVRSLVAELGEHHTVEVWADPGAVRPLARRLSAVNVVAVPETEAGKRLTADSPELVMVSDHKSARQALNSVPNTVPVAYWMIGDEQHAQREARRLTEFSKQLDVVVCNGAGIRATLVSTLGTRAVPVLDTSLRTSPPLATSTESAQSGTRSAVAVGPLVRDAGFGDIIRGFDDSQADGWTLTIYGDGGHKGPLARLIDWREAQESIRIHAPNDIALMLDGVSVFVTSGATSEHGALVLDAAARGIPVVGFDGDPYAALVAQAGGGVLVPAGAHRALSAAISYFVADAKALRSAGVAAQELARDLDDQATLPWQSALATLATRPPRRAPRLNGRHAQRDASLGARAADAQLKESVQRVLTAAGVPHAQVALGTGPDGPQGTAIVAGTEHIQTVVDALFADEELSIASLSAWVRDHAAHPHPATSRTELPIFVGHTNRLEVTGAGAGHQAHVGIDFWKADGQGIRHAPRPNREADWVAPDSWNNWLSGQSATVTGLPLWDQITFPIDAVFTWVDDSDPQWRAKWVEHSDQPKDSAAGDPGLAQERFINRDEIYSSVAAARHHLPWLRRIIVVTDGQRHSRIESDFPEVEFVDHREVFPDPTVLPVFNSHAIEAALHRIPGLANHFLYFNDDVFVVKPLDPSAFFTANGTAKFFPSGLKVNFHDGLPGEPHLLAAANNRALLAKDFGIEITNSMLHTPHPHVRTVLEEMESRYPAEFQDTMASRHRSGDDVSVLSSFAQYYGWATQRYQPSTLEYRFVRLHAADLEGRINRVVNDDSVEVVCLGEPLPHQSRDPDEGRIVSEFLERLRH